MDLNFIKGYDDCMEVCRPPCVPLILSNSRLYIVGAPDGFLCHVMLERIHEFVGLVILDFYLALLDGCYSQFVGFNLFAVL